MLIYMQGTGIKKKNHIFVSSKTKKYGFFLTIRTCPEKFLWRQSL